MSFLILLYRYLIRDLLQQPVRTGLTVSGVALGIAVVVAVHLANERAVGSFSDSLQAINGQADLQISANGVPLDEELMAELSWIWDWGAMAALVQGRAGLPGGLSVPVYGIDLLAEVPFREYSSSEGRRLALDVTLEEDFLDLLAHPRKLILPKRLVKRLGLSRTSPLKLLILDREIEFEVGAILADSGPAEAFGGNVLFMDIAAAQLAFQKIGLVDRIDIRLDPGVEAAAVRKRLVGQLPPTANLTSSRDLIGQSEKMFRAFRFNLAALSYLSLIVGVILVYNTLNLAVVRRQAEIAILRTMGTERRTVMGLFVSEAVLLGLLGAAIGLWLGRLLSGGAEALVGRTVESLYTGISTFPFRDRGNLGFYGTMLLLGAGLGGISGFFPALSATAQAPVTVLRKGLLVTGKVRSYRGHALLATLLVGAGIWLSRAPAISGLPLWGYLAAVCFIVGFGLSAPMLGRILLRGVAGFGGFLPVEARLALQSLEGGLSRLIVAVVSLMIAVAMLVSVATMVGSFRETVIVWVDQTLVADLYVKAAGAGNNDWESVISPQTIEVLEKAPGIAATGRFRGRPIQFRGGRVSLAGGDFVVLSEYGNLMFVDGRSAPEVVAQMVGLDRVIVSEPLANKYGVERGNLLQLPTPGGRHPFQVSGVYYDYSSERGTIVMDWRTYVKYFPDDGATSLALYLEEGASPSQTIRFIAEALPETKLSIYPNSRLKEQALRIFDQTFRVTYALEIICILVAVLGVTNTLSALILERRGEIAILKFLGADRRQIRRMGLFEAGLVGVLGSALGFALGMILSLLLIYVINRQSFGWTIQFELPAVFLLSALGLVLLSTLMAGFYPAAIALRTDPIRSLRTE